MMWYLYCLSCALAGFFIGIGKYDLGFEFSVLGFFACLAAAYFEWRDK